MEVEIQRIQKTLSGKSRSSKDTQTIESSANTDQMCQRISELENDYDEVLKENKEFIQYAKNLENNLNNISKQKDYYQSEFEKLNNANGNKHVKSMTSLAYSMDDEANELETNLLESDQKQDLGMHDDSPTFYINDKENIDENTSLQHTEIINSQRSLKQRGATPVNKKIKLSQIKYKDVAPSKTDRSVVQQRSTEQLILITEQRAEIEKVQKHAMSLENKLEYDTKDKNHTITQLEQQIDTLKQLNTKLKSERSSGESDNLQHYIDKLELNEITLQGQLQEESNDKEYLQQHNDDLIVQLQELQENNLQLKNRLVFEDMGIDEDSMISTLSQKVTQQKREIRELQGNVEKLKDKNDNLIAQINQKGNMGNQYDQNLLHSQLSCSLGLSKGIQRDLTPIQSLVHRVKPINIQNDLVLASLESSKYRLDESKSSKKGGLKESDLGLDNYHKGVSKDDNYLSNSLQEAATTESVVKWLQGQANQQEKIIEALAEELQVTMAKNNELNMEVVE